MNKIEIVQAEGNGIESATRGYLARGTRGYYRHVPVMREVDKQRLLNVLEAQVEEAKAKKPLTQAQIVYRMKLKGYLVVEDGLYHRTDSIGYAKVMYRHTDGNFVIVTPDGALEWYNGKRRAEYVSGWISPELMKKEIDKYNRTKPVSELRRVMPIDWNVERPKMLKALKRGRK